MNPLVYISLVNWNRADITLVCIEQLNQLTYENYRIVVVDNASIDDSVKRIQSTYPEVLLLQSEENDGYAGGHQLAVQEALTDDVELVWILNNDVQIEPDTLTYLVESYQQNGVGLFGGIPLAKQKDTGQDIVLMHYKFLNTQYEEILFDRDSFKPYQVLFPKPEKIQRISAISGSCFLLPVSVVEQHGYMDTSYFMYSEEIDYCFRLREKGVPIWIVPQAIIWHEGEGSSSGINSQLSAVVQYYRIRNQLIRIQRFGSLWDIFRVMIKNLMLCAFTLLRGNFPRAIFMIRGMRDGLRQKTGKTFAPENYLQRD